MRNQINFPALVILKIICEHGTDDKGVVFQKFSELSNEWLKKEGITSQYSPKIAYNMNNHQLVAKLLATHGLIERVGIRKGFCCTVRGQSFIERLGDWKKWPLQAEIEDGEIDPSTCIYASDY